MFVCHHGAGYSGTSFACMAQEVGALAGGICGVLVIDARRHGGCGIALYMLWLIVSDRQNDGDGGARRRSLDRYTCRRFLRGRVHRISRRGIDTVTTRTFTGVFSVDPNS